MTEGAHSILGSAVFGTTRGLSAAGNGVLAGARNCVGIFEFRGSAGQSGQLRDSDLHKPAIFYRRVEDTVSRGRQIVLVGVLKACSDSLSRPGFFGVCVALELDMKSSGFSDWPSCSDVIRNLFVEMERQVDPSSGQLEFNGDAIIRPLRHDESAEWITCQGTTLLLHTEGTRVSGNESLHRLQAVAFAWGHEYPTALALHAAAPGSHALDADHVEAALATWTRAREPVVSEPRHEHVEQGEPGDPNSGLDAVWGRITRLEEAVKRLQSARPAVQYRPPPDEPDSSAMLRSKAILFGAFFGIGVTVGAVAIVIALRFL